MSIKDLHLQSQRKQLSRGTDGSGHRSSSFSIIHILAGTPRPGLRSIAKSFIYRHASMSLQPPANMIHITDHHPAGPTYYSKFSPCQCRSISKRHRSIHYMEESRIICKQRQHTSWRRPAAAAKFVVILATAKTTSWESMPLSRRRKRCRPPINDVTCHPHEDTRQFVSEIPLVQHELRDHLGIHPVLRFSKQ